MAAPAAVSTIAGTGRTIELTADGGKTWRVVLRTPRPVMSLSLFGGAEWARFDDGENLRSDNGGRAWAPAVAPFPTDSVCPQGTQQSYVSFAPGGDEWALCTTEGGAGNMGKKRVAYTPGRRGTAMAASRATAIRSESPWRVTGSA